MVNSFIFLLTITIVLLHTVFAFKEGYHTFSSRFGDNKIRYKELLPTKVNKNLPPVICIHGFGGNADQFRKNMPALAANGYRTYAIDLLGYGYSDKPNPKLYGVNEIYNFENWSEQIVQFIQDIVKQPSVLVCNSVGSCVGLQTAVTREDLVKGAVLINMSLRLLHVSKQKAFEKPIVPLLQKVLRETEVGKTFFSQV